MEVFKWIVHCERVKSTRFIFILEMYSIDPIEYGLKRSREEFNSFVIIDW